jgi:hypothetical protein
MPNKELSRREAAKIVALFLAGGIPSIAGAGIVIESQSEIVQMNDDREKALAQGAKTLPTETIVNRGGGYVEQIPEISQERRVKRRRLAGQTTVGFGGIAIGGSLIFCGLYRLSRFRSSKR